MAVKTVQVEIKEYVKIFRPGFGSADQDVVELEHGRENWSPPADASGWYFMEKRRFNPDKPWSKIDYITVSPTYYRGRVLTVQDAAREYGAQATLVKNMLNNNFTRVVRLNTGEHWSIKPEDIVLS